jgi:hypothetical protein
LQDDVDFLPSEGWRGTLEACVGVPRLPWVSVT